MPPRPAAAQASLQADLVGTLATTLDCEFALAGLLEPGTRRIRTLAAQIDGAPVRLDYAIEGTPCGDVLRGRGLVIASGVQKRYPRDRELVDLDLESYVGARFIDPRSGRPGLVVAGSSRRFERPAQALQAARAFAASIESALAAEAAALDSQIVHKALEAVDEGLLVIEGEGRLRHANSAATRLLRLEGRGETLGERLSDTAREALQPLLAALRSGRSWHQQLAYRATPLQLAPRILDLQLVPFDDAEGSAAVVLRDVSGAVEQAARLELMLDSAGGVPWEWLPIEGKFVTTPAFNDLLAITPTDDAGSNSLILSDQVWRERIHPDDLAALERSFQEAFEDGSGNLRTTARLRRDDGDYRWMHSFGRVIEWTADRRPVRAIGCAFDVDAEQRASAEVERLELQLRRFVENTPAAVVMLDRNLTYLVVSDGWCRLHGVQEQELIGRPHDRHDPDFDERWRGRFERCLAGGLEWADRERRRMSDGREAWVRWRLQPWQDGEGRIGGCVLVVEDITLAVEHETRIAEARDQALAANLAKSAFLANMSHEIRTPLTAVLGFADLLLERGAEPDRTVEFATTIQRNATHLLALVDDILDLSKIEVGKMSVERRAVELGPLLRGTIDLFRARAEAKGLALSLELDPGLPPYVRTDPTRLRQVVSNLIGNAIKFTERGSVELVVRGQQAHGQFSILVRDTGIGMTAEQAGRIFERFAQADETTTRRFGGTGLGLAISKQLAELLGGELEVDSVPGLGSTFELRLPLETVAPDEQAVPEPSIDGPRAALPDRPLEGRRVLLAEDGQDNQRLIGLLLRRAGAELSIVADGRQAVDAVLAAQDTEQAFELVLMDIQMPVLDGYAATAELRAAGVRIPIAALTAHTLSAERERAAAAGCSAFLSKPIDRRALIATAAELLERGAGARAASATDDGPQRNVPG